MVIYADILLAVNWWIDFLLLIGVGRFIGIFAHVWRIIIASFVGGLFSVLLFFPALPAWATLLLKIVSAAIMVFIAFGKCTGHQFVKILSVLFGISAGLAGLCSALYFYIAPPKLYVYNGVVYYAASPWLLLGLTLLCYGLLRVIEYINRRRAPLHKDYIVTIVYQNHSITIHCLYDSGNHLVEPFSNQPVILVERSSVSRLLCVPEQLTSLPLNGLWRVIPFNSIGGDGLLPAFRPDALSIADKPITNCYIAVCNRLGRGEYQGLIGTALGNYLEQLEA